ncbi:hypothetical protein DZF91_12970 [Actinomadura logoneensis]|uniref:Uncharacterized protein n=1 Tax=Actinomadura logoneensis TaxID=2293572 RepID=A0A372JML1_9ACTN|nr:hypothetical protein [Actinomadura logoneensis]RFU41190.1 hypothetical protein DZF91_12970 [Actinomadura logoneensis]
MSHDDRTIPPVGREPAPSSARDAVSAVPALVARQVCSLVDPLALVSLLSPDDAGTTLDMHEGQIGVLPFRPGLTCPGRAWSGRLDWAALILYPATTKPVKYPISEDRLATDAAQAKVYLFPAHIFTERAWREGGTFQHIDHRNDTQPGVFWVNLEDAPARGDLDPYEIANPFITDRS